VPTVQHAGWRADQLKQAAGLAGPVAGTNALDMPTPAAAAAAYRATAAAANNSSLRAARTCRMLMGSM